MFDVKRFRKQKGLTQNDFAKQLGYARATVANMEAGNQPVNDNFLDKLAEVFEIDVEEFKSYNQKVPLVVTEPEKEYLNLWKEKYYTLLEEYNSLLLKFTKNLEEKGLMKDQTKKENLSDN